MSGWVDFIAARRDEADEVASFPDPKKKWPGTEAKMIMPGDLLPLLTILLDGQGPGASEKEFDYLIIDDRAIVYSFPARLTELLSDLTISDRPAVVTAWRAADQRMNRNDYVPKFLDGLCDVAQRAVAEGKIIIARHSLID